MNSRSRTNQNRGQDLNLQENQYQNDYQDQGNESREIVARRDLQSSSSVDRESSTAMPEWRVWLSPDDDDPALESDEVSDHRESFARRNRRASSEARESGCATAGLRVLLAPEAERSNPLLLVPFPSEVFPTEYYDRLPEWRLRAGHSVIREHWRNWEELQMAAICTALGWKKIVKFPILVARYGQGTFLFAFILVEFLIGFPLLFLEMAVGQYTAKDPVRVLSLVPILEGMRVPIIIIAVLSIVYINIYLAYVAYIMCLVFNNIDLKTHSTWQMPWGQCEMSSKQVRHWSICKHVKPALANNTDFLCVAHFYHNIFQDIHDECSSSDYSDGHVLHWPLLGCMLSVTVVTYVFIFNGIKTIGRSVVVMIPVVCVLVFVCLIAAMCQSGALDGIAFILKPDFKYLYDFEMWCVVIASVVESLNLGTGAMVVIGSYATYETSMHYHAFFVCLADTIFSLVAVCLVACFIGISAHEYQVAISDVISQETNDVSLNAFVFTATFIAKTSGSPVWAIFMFLIALCLSEMYKFASFLIILRPICDTYPGVKKRKLIATLVLLLLMCVITLPFLQTTWIGVYVKKIASAGPIKWLCVLLITIFVATIVYGYGITRIRQDFDYMLHFLPNKFFCIVWMIAPCIFLVVIIIDMVVTSSSYSYWQAWVAFILIIIAIPIVALWNVTRYQRKGQLSLVLHPRDEAKWSHSSVAKEQASTNLVPRLPATMSLRTRRATIEGERHVAFGSHHVTLIPPSSISVISAAMSETNLMYDDEESSNGDEQTSTESPTASELNNPGSSDYNAIHPALGR